MGLNSETIYEMNDYKKFLVVQINANSSIRGYHGKLAKAAGCGRSFFSQVLRGSGHLTPDQAAGLARFWELDDDASAQFLDLVILARSGSVFLKNHLIKQIDRRCKKRSRVSTRLGPHRHLPLDAQIAYYTGWEMPAVHLLVGIPEFQKVSTICERLGVSPATVNHCLSKLQQLKMIRSTANGGWEVVEKNLLLPDESPLIRSYHSAWRHMAMVKLQINRENSLHYTTLHSLSREDLPKLKTIVLEAIEKMRKVVAPSAEEELVCFACDLFKV